MDTTRGNGGMDGMQQNAPLVILSRRTLYSSPRRIIRKISRFRQGSAMKMALVKRACIALNLWSCASLTHAGFGDNCPRFNPVTIVAK